MSDQNEVMRKLASVRRALDDLEEEVATAEGAMPEGNRPADGGRQNYLVVLKRLEGVEELAGEAADKMRSVLKTLDS